MNPGYRIRPTAAALITDTAVTALITTRAAPGATQEGLAPIHIPATGADQIEAALAQVAHRADARLAPSTLVIAYPARYGPQRRARIRHAATAAGWSEVALIADAVAVSVTQPLPAPDAAAVYIDATTSTPHLTLLAPQPPASHGYIAATHTAAAGSPVAHAIHDVCGHANLDPAAIAHTWILTHNASPMDILGPTVGATTAISPAQLAWAAHTAHTDITRPHPTPAPAGLWPRPAMAALSITAGAWALVTTVTHDVHDATDAATVAIASTAVSTGIAAVGVYVASRIAGTSTSAVRWQRVAGTFMTTAITAAMTTLVVLAAIAAAAEVSLWQLAWTMALPGLVPAAALAVMAWHLWRHPAPPRVASLWPPAGALVAAACASHVIATTALHGHDSALPEVVFTRGGVAVWVMACGAIIATRPTARLACIPIAAVAALIAGPVTVPLIGAAVVVTVCGWWCLRAAHTLGITSRSHHTRLEAHSS